MVWVYKQKVGILLGTNYAPLLADLILYCYERDFMANLQKYKRFDLIDKLNDTSQYLDDIFIDNPEFEIRSLYLSSRTSVSSSDFNKANTSDIEFSCQDLKIKVNCNGIHTGQRLRRTR